MRLPSEGVVGRIVAFVAFGALVGIAAALDSAFYFLVAMAVPFGIVVLRRWTEPSASARERAVSVEPARTTPTRPSRAVPLAHRPGFSGHTDSAWVAFLVATFTLPFISVRFRALPLSDVCYGISFLLLLFDRKVSLSLDRRIDPLVLGGAVCYLIGALLTTAVNSPTLSSLYVVARFGYATLVWFWLGVQVVHTPARVRAATSAFTLGVAVNGAVALSQAALHLPLPFTHNEYGRYTGFSVAPDDLGGMGCIALPISLALAISSSGRRRTVFTATTALVCVGIALSGSVAALAAAATGVVAFAIVSRHGDAMPYQRSWRTLVGVVIALGLGAVVVLSASSSQNFILSRFTSLVTGETTAATASSVGDRTDQYTFALRSIYENPFIGVGLDDESRKIETASGNKNLNVHSLLLRTFYEVGLLGIVGMLAIEFGLVRLAARLLRRLPGGSWRALAAGLMAALLAGMALGLVQSILFQRYFWLPAVLTLAYGAATRRVAASTTTIPSGVAVGSPA